jgi:transposase
MRQKLLGASRLFVDETRAPVLDPGRGRTKTGYFWTIVRDDRGWGGSDPPAVAHARRRFFELTKGSAAPIASEALRRIARLYANEADIRGQDASIRKAVRQEQSRPLVLDLKLWLETRLKEVSGRSPMAEAIRYTLSRWDGLTRFLDNGRIELDSNPVEQTIRPIALNRKNALFAGSDEGAENWAVLATLIECCKLHDVNPNSYLTDVLTRLVNGHLDGRLDELTPWAWKPASYPQ